MACFRTDKDRHVFLKYLRDSLDKEGCSVNAFVMMTNHVHMLVTPSEPGAMPAMMHSIGTRYVRYFNKVHGRTGPLFGGRYWASLIESEGYLLAVMRYIELNPVRARMVDHPGRYPWSSYLHNTGGERREELTFHGEFMNLGRTIVDCTRWWASFVDKGVADDELARLRKQFTRNRPLGGDAFIERFGPSEDVPGS